ncbi:hypothetical protein HDU90_005838 [Geranomyces variabilis]|nr:hypothetical protein HDU90_005838 [Geranomyces variabilis]
MAREAPPLVCFQNSELDGTQRQWLRPTSFDAAKETVTFTAVAFTLRNEKRCPECIKEIESNKGLFAKSSKPTHLSDKEMLTCLDYRDNSSRVSARFDGWLVPGQSDVESNVWRLPAAFKSSGKGALVRIAGFDHEYNCIAVSKEDFSSTGPDHDESREEDPYTRCSYQIQSFTASISWILQGLTNCHVTAKSLAPRLLRGLAERLQTSDATAADLFGTNLRAYYGDFHPNTDYGVIAKQIRRQTCPDIFDGLLQKDHVQNRCKAIGANENIDSPAKWTEWSNWLYDTYFKDPHSGACGRLIWYALRTPGFCSSYAKAANTHADSYGFDRFLEVDKVVLFGMRYSTNHIEFLRPLFEQTPQRPKYGRARPLYLQQGWWRAMMSENLVPFAELTDKDQQQLAAASWWANWESDACTLISSPPSLALAESSRQAFWSLVSTKKVKIADHGFDFLAAAIRSHDTELFRQLLAAGCPLAPNRELPNQTPLLSLAMATEGKAIDILKLLLAMPDICRDDWSAAIKRGLWSIHKVAVQGMDPLTESIEIMIRHVEPDIIDLQAFICLCRFLQGRPDLLTLLTDRVGKAKLQELCQLWTQDPGQDITVALSAHFRLLAIGIEIFTFEGLVIALTESRSWARFLNVQNSTIDIPMVGGMREITPRTLFPLLLNNGKAAILFEAVAAFVPQGHIPKEDVARWNLRRISVIKGICNGLADWIRDHNIDECSDAQEHIVRLLGFLTKHGIKRIRPMYLCEMAAAKGLNAIVALWAPGQLLFHASGTLRDKALRGGWRLLASILRDVPELFDEIQVGWFYDAIKFYLENCDPAVLRTEEEGVVALVSSIRDTSHVRFDRTGFCIHYAVRLGWPRLMQVQGVESVFKHCKIGYCLQTSPSSGYIEPQLTREEIDDRTSRLTASRRRCQTLKGVGGMEALMRLLTVPPSHRDTSASRLEHILNALSVHIFDLRTPEERAELVTGTILPTLHRAIAEFPETSNFRSGELSPALVTLLGMAQQRGIDELSSMYKPDYSAGFVFGEKRRPARFQEGWTLPPPTAKARPLLDLNNPKPEVPIQHFGKPAFRLTSGSSRAGRAPKGLSSRIPGSSNFFTSGVIGGLSASLPTAAATPTSAVELSLTLQGLTLTSSQSAPRSLFDLNHPPPTIQPNSRESESPLAGMAETLSGVAERARQQGDVNPSTNLTGLFDSLSTVAVPTIGASAAGREGHEDATSSSSMQKKRKAEAWKFRY